MDFSFQLTWSLRIRNVNRDDAGVYECQATTHPPQAIFVRLKVVGKSIFLSKLKYLHIPYKGKISIADSL